MTNGHGAAFTLGIFICIGLFGLGMSLGSSIHRLKAYERVVTVKGLANGRCRPISRSGPSPLPRPITT